MRTSAVLPSVKPLLKRVVQSIDPMMIGINVELGLVMRIAHPSLTPARCVILGAVFAIKLVRALPPHSNAKYHPM